MAPAAKRNPGTGGGLRGRRAVAWLAIVPLLGLCASAGAGAVERLAGPVPAEVVAILDGDTLEVRARVWLGQVVTTRVRLDGVDAPELTGKCGAERRRAARARDFLAGRLAAGPGRPAAVVLRDIRFGKFAGRVLARVETAMGEDLGRGLIAAGLARPYAGGRRRPWCDAEG